jgi:parallel beta-helix repeat protein
MKRRYIAIMITSLFLLANFASASIILKQNNENFEINNSEHTETPIADIYVDDDADPRWYDATHVKTIQEGIGNASSGNTIFVYNGTYYENVDIFKKVDLFGENRNTTIIDGKENGNVVTISADYILINGFTIKNSSKSLLDNSGIEVDSNFTTISNNTITYNVIGVRLDESSDNTIVDNIILKNRRRLLLSNGIDLYRSSNNIISGNIIESNVFGLELYESDNNMVSKNIIKRNIYGIYVWKSSSCNITKNTITQSILGVGIMESSKNSIKCNNFVLNFYHSSFLIKKISHLKNTWDGNYWNRPRVAPYLIRGDRIRLIPFFSIFRLPLFKIDWHPAKQPYDI